MRNEYYGMTVLKYTLSFKKKLRNHFGFFFFVFGSCLKYHHWTKKKANKIFGYSLVKLKSKFDRRAVEANQNKIRNIWLHWKHINLWKADNIYILYLLFLHIFTIATIIPNDTNRYFSKYFNLREFFNWPNVIIAWSFGLGKKRSSLRTFV